MVEIKINDIILDSGKFYKVLDVHKKSETMDLKCYNEPLIYKSVPISNLNQEGIQILDKIPENLRFMNCK